MPSKKAPAKPAKPAAKSAPKPAAKAPAKTAAKPAGKVPAVKVAAKPAAPSKPAPKAAVKAPAGKAPAAAPVKPGAKVVAMPAKAIIAGKTGAAAKPAEDEEATEAPVPELPHHTPPAGRPSLCLIEIVKDGHFFIARTDTASGAKEYKNTVFEDLLTEMLITLQEQLIDK